MHKKTKDKRNNEIMNIALNDLDIAKRELTHYPHHVLARAFLGACRLIVLMDPENKFNPDNKLISEANDQKIIFLANEMADHVMEVYLSNKDEIDARLLRELH